MATDTARVVPRASRALLGWARRVGLGQKLAVALAVVAGASGVLTYGVMTGSVPLIQPDPTNVLVLLNLDLVLLLSLAAVIARRVVELSGERRRGLAGSRLHVRLVVLFSVIAVVPTIVVAVFSVLFFHFGLQAWFSQRVKTALSESLVVAQAYLKEHEQVVAGDILAMANDLNREGFALLTTPNRLQRIVENQALMRALPEAVVFDNTGRILARSGLTFRLELETVPDWAMDEARRGGVAVLTNEDEDRLRAIVRLDEIGNAFLYVGRYVEKRVLNHLERVRTAVADYEQLEGQRGDIEITFAMIFATVSLLFLLIAVWVGLTFAMRLARPVSALVAAAERIRAGDLTVRVPDSEGSGELGSLSRAFNRMTSQLDSQRGELIEANRQLDDRRRFTETVLAGVSSGVIGLDRGGLIHFPNRAASDLLSTDLHRAIGEPLDDVVPEMAPALAEARARPREAVETQVTLTRDGAERNLLMRVVIEPGAGGEGIAGMVVTFTDITALLSAQRKAAWADVARRIAHEIKNPLTPIQLSAERLKRRYLKEIESDPETFSMCTDTIVRQVDDLRRMVDEFSAFARLPAPVMRRTDLKVLCRQSLLLQQNANPRVAYTLELPDEPAEVDCDPRQVAQALTNLLQNAVEGIEGRLARDGEAAPPGRIVLALARDDREARLSVEDNGIGLPKGLRDRLTEPYVTTRSKGTGLGLAIVKHIVEDHAGRLLLEDAADGARVSLVLPAPQDDAGLELIPVQKHAHGA